LKRLRCFLSGLEAQDQPFPGEHIGDARNAFEQLLEIGVALVMWQEAGMKGDKFDVQLRGEVGHPVALFPTNIGAKLEDIQADANLARSLNVKLVPSCRLLPHDERDSDFKKLLDRVARIADMFPGK